MVATNFLTIFIASSYLAFSRAQPSLRFQGDINIELCPNDVGIPIINSIQTAVSAAARQKGIVEADDTRYSDFLESVEDLVDEDGTRRQLRSWCSSRCPPGYSSYAFWQYCFIIGCPPVRRELSESEDFSETDCTTLKLAAYHAIAQQAMTAADSGDMTAMACAGTVATLDISCD